MSYTKLNCCSDEPKLETVNIKVIHKIFTFNIKPVTRYLM